MRRIEYKKDHSMSFRGNQCINDYTDLHFLQHSEPAVATIHVRIVAAVPSIGVASIVATIGVAAIPSIRVAAIVPSIGVAAVSASIAIAE